MSCRAFWYQLSCSWLIFAGKAWSESKSVEIEILQTLLQARESVISLNVLPVHKELILSGWAFLPAWIFHPFRLNPSNFDVPLTWDQRSIHFISCKFHGLNSLVSFKTPQAPLPARNASSCWNMLKHYQISLSLSPFFTRSVLAFWSIEMWPKPLHLL